MKQFWIILITLTAFYSPQSSSGVPAGYQRVAARHGLPADLFYALALTESQHPELLKPWPWAANRQGKSYWFNSREALYEQLLQWQRAGATNFDIGLGQINWYWHHHRFDSLWDATDPYINLAVSARFLRELYDQSGSFEIAVGRYHSRHPERARQYLNRVKNRLARVSEVR